MDTKILYKEMTDRIIQFSYEKSDIRCLAMIGSRSREENTWDEYSDLDLVIITSDFEKYLNTSDWLPQIGRFWFSFKETAPEINHYERRTLFDNGLDVDFVLADSEQIRNNPDSFPVLKELCEKSIKVLIDKDNYSPTLSNYIKVKNSIPLLSEVEFLEVINDFYFHTVWCLKKIKRGELWIAIKCLNFYLKSLLLKMIEMYEHCNHGIKYDTWYDGRKLEKWADKMILKKLENTFAHYDQNDMIKALLETNDLFSSLAKDIALKKKYLYPNNIEKEYLAWLNNNID